MNKKAVFFLLSMCFLPLIIFFGYYFIKFTSEKRTKKEMFLAYNKKEECKFKIDSIYKDKWNHNTLTLRGENDTNTYTVERQWENDIFKIGDSIVKIKGSVKIYLYRNKKLDTILDYNNIYIKEN